MSGHFCEELYFLLMQSLRYKYFGGDLENCCVYLILQLIRSSPHSNLTYFYCISCLDIEWQKTEF